MASKDKSARQRNFCGVCYDEQIDLVRNYLKDFEKRGIIRAYYYIMHNPESEEKQKHYHFLIEYYDAKTLSAVTKAIGVRDGIVQSCSDVRSYACYLIHKFELDKERYSPNLVETNDKERYRSLILAENSNEACSDKQVYYLFEDMLINYPDMQFHDIIMNLCNNKNITIRTIRKNIYLFKNLYLSYKGLEHFKEV